MANTWRNTKGHGGRTVPDAARRTEGYYLSDPRAVDAFAPPPGAKVPVTEDTALTLSAVWACTRVITGSVSILPLHVYEKASGGREEVARSEGLRAGLSVETAAGLATDPCPEVGPMTFWETLVGHAVNRGSGYAEIEEDGFGNPIALWLLPAGTTRPFRDPKTKELRYESYATIGGVPYRSVLPAKNVFHLAGLGFDGLTAYSVVGMARRSLGLTATSEQAGESFFGNGMRPGGWVEYPGSLAEMQKLNAEEGLQGKHGGASKFGKALLLWGGMKYHQLDIKPDDAQFLQTRQFQVEEVCRWYNVPPHKVKHLLRATFSNIEHQGQEFVTDTLLYWLEKIAQEFRRKILSRYGPRYYAEHTVDKLLRGDTIARYTAYGLGRQWGFLSPNDCRRRENLPPIPKGDTYHVPVNMAPLGSEPRPVDPGGASGSANRAMLHFLAKSLAEVEADELMAVAVADPDLLALWVDRVTPGDLEHSTGVQGWANRVRRLLPGFDLAAFLALHAANRCDDVRKLVESSDIGAAAIDLAARWAGSAQSVLLRMEGYVR